MILDEILNILKFSNDVAYTVDNKSYTYKELYKYVCNIYHLLLQINKNKRPVVVYGHKEVYMKASFLACSFAGMAYVPIDKSMPQERINRIIDQIKPDVSIGIEISTKQIYRIMNNENFQDIEQLYLKPNDIYYIIFTSGSTGIPKGVKVTYENLNSCIHWLKDITEMEKGVILNQANYSFDLSVADLYLSLIKSKRQKVDVSIKIITDSYI